MSAGESAKKLNDSYRSWKEQSNTSGMCPVRNVLDCIADKWTLIVLVTLASQPHRFGELRREIPEISQRMLTKTLTTLQQNGFINRTVYPTKPPSVEYSLTSLGTALMIPLWGLVNWSTIHADTIEHARRRYNREYRRT